MKNVYKVVLFPLIGLLIIGAILLYGSYQFEKGIANLQEEEFEKAHATLSPLAALGHTKSQVLIGEMYAFGRGVKKDFDQANEWFNRAGRFSFTFEDSPAEHKFYVGRDYIEGSGLLRNREEGMKWIRLAAKEGYPDAIKYLSTVKEAS